MAQDLEKLYTTWWTVSVMLKRANRMNQRIRRGRGKGKGQRIDASTVNTGGYVANHSRDAEPEVRVRQKASGDVSPETPRAADDNAGPRL